MTVPHIAALTDARASLRRRPVPCSRACSPSATDKVNIDTERAANIHQCDRSPKLNMLSRGESNDMTRAPSSPSRLDHHLTTPATNGTREGGADEMSRTALSRMLRRVAAEIMSMAELHIATIATPAGPIHNAMSLLRATEQSMLTACTPLNIPSALSTVRDTADMSL